MGSYLCIDVGNSRTKVGEFHDRELIKQHTFTNEEVLKNSMMLDEMDLDGLIISSVNQEVSELLKLEEKPFVCLQLNHETPLPIKLLYQTPDTLGKDRIAIAVGASVSFPHANVMAIDAGTCITYDLVTSDREYLGGAISPGLQMRLKAMHFGTSSLPLIHWNPNEFNMNSKIGTSTISSMISGVVNGIKAEMKSFIEDSSTKRSSLKVILSGGDADFFEKELKNGIFADPNLVLKGLNEILLYNLHN